MECWWDTEWFANDGGRSIAVLKFQDSDYFGTYRPDDAGERTVLEKYVDFEQDNPLQ